MFYFFFSQARDLRSDNLSSPPIKSLTSFKGKQGFAYNFWPEVVDKGKHNRYVLSSLHITLYAP